MTPAIQEIKAHLSVVPRSAQELAESAELPIEQVYHSLVWLYDRGEAAIDSDRHANVVRGWVEGVNA